MVWKFTRNLYFRVSAKVFSINPSEDETYLQKHQSKTVTPCKWQRQNDTVKGLTAMQLTNFLCSATQYFKITTRITNENIISRRYRFLEILYIIFRTFILRTIKMHINTTQLLFLIWQCFSCNFGISIRPN